MKSIKPIKPLQSLSQFKSREEWEICVWEKLTADFAKVDSGERMRKLLTTLVTSHEKKNIINRAATLSLLKQRKSYREIGELLWLSPQTISAIRKSMAQSGYASHYMRNKKHEKKQKPLTKKEIEKLIFNAKVEAFFTFPPPPIPHPRPMRQLGYKPFQKRKYG